MGPFTDAAQGARTEPVRRDSLSTISERTHKNLNEIEAIVVNMLSRVKLQAHDVCSPEHPPISDLTDAAYSQERSTERILSSLSELRDLL